MTAVCACEAPITADLAVHTEQSFGSSADTWLAMQTAYDLAQDRQSACEIRQIEPAT